MVVNEALKTANANFTTIRLSGGVGFDLREEETLPWTPSVVFTANAPSSEGRGKVKLNLGPRELKSGDLVLAWNENQDLTAVRSLAFTETSGLRLVDTQYIFPLLHYGSGAKGSWGWKNGYGEYNKSYYSLKIFGDIVTDFTQKVAATAGEETTVSAFAGLSADGKKAFVLVADYRGRFPLVAHIEGLDNARVEKAIVLDHTRNNEPVEVTWRNGTLTLPRKDRNSAAFYVVFARP